MAHRQQPIAYHLGRHGQLQIVPVSPELIGTVAAVAGLRALTSLMDDCSRVNLAMLQWLTECQTPWEVDRAVGDMKLDSQHGPRLATYARYNVLLEQGWLSSALNVNMSPDSGHSASQNGQSRQHEGSR